MFQPIVGYHRDEQTDWVAVLGCLHFQHVRHNPPWCNREWVTSATGRDEHLGRMLYCRKCNDNQPQDTGDGMNTNELRIPADMKSYKKTPVFDRHSAPNGLQREHATAAGVWALLHVLSGTLTFRFSEAGESVSCEVTPDKPRVIVPQQPHHVVIAGPVSFQLEFFRRAG